MTWSIALNSRRKEFSFLAVVVILAVLRPDKFFNRIPSPPANFFPTESPVLDFHNASFTDLFGRVSESDVSFIMYYAPWEAECQKFRTEFEIIASHHNQIFFAAINCWWPEGECRRRYSFKRYPQLSAYVHNAGEVSYNGPLVPSYIIPFLDNLVNPIQSLGEESQLLDLISRSDGVVVGYFDLSEPTSSYSAYFKAAVRSLQSDPWRRVKFTVITSRKTAHKLGIYQFSSITVYSWDLQSKVRSDFKNSDAIIEWVYKTLFDGRTSLVEWLTPSGHKSDTLVTRLKKNDTFILLTPRSLILGSSPYYDILREVAMDYYNCDNSPVIKSLIMRSILSRRAVEETLVEMEEKCHEMENPIQDKSEAILSSDYIQDSCCHSQIIRWYLSGKAMEKKCYCTACVHIDLTKCPSNCKMFNCFATAGRYLNSFEPLKANKTASYCNEISASFQSKYTPYYKIKMTCSGNLPLSDVRSQVSSAYENDNEESFYLSSSSIYRGSVLFNDERIQHMMRGFDDRFCSRLALGLKYSDFNFPDSGEGSTSLFSKNWREGFTGLGCRADRVVKFLAIDSILYPHFAESLGLDILNETHATTALIIEPQKDFLYLLNHQAASACCSSLTINKRAIYETIKNFTDNQLERFVRGSNRGAISSSEDCLRQVGKSNVVCVPEVSSSTFESLVYTPHKDVIIFYYTPWCEYCSSITHVYSTVAKYFHSLTEVIFARINADANKLPFEYSVDKFPSIVIFPADRKYEPTSFSRTSAITPSSLMNFILKNAQLSVRSKILFSLCDKKCLLKEWFRYRRRHESVFSAYRSLISEHNFLQNQLVRKKRSQRELQKPLLEEMQKKIHKLRRSMAVLPIIRRVVEEGLGSKQLSFLELNNETKEWLEYTTERLHEAQIRKSKKSKKSKKKSRETSRRT